jgi:hypothetical protein
MPKSCSLRASMAAVEEVMEHLLRVLRSDVRIDPGGARTIGGTL